jgi:hypothetical protein
MKKFHFSGKAGIILLGIASTVWFLVRVIPKPSRAAYPCMRAAAPLMSGFVVYLLSLGSIAIAFRKVRQNWLRARYLAVIAFVLVALASLFVSLSVRTRESFADNPVKTGPDDGPNQPMGKGVGVKPGRVIWVWDPKATNANCINAFDLHKPENTNQGVVNRMVADAVMKLGDQTNLGKSWEALFRNFNSRKKGDAKGYTQGEKIFIKINQGTANGKLSQKDQQNGFYISDKLSQSQEAKKGNTGTCETYPAVVLELLRELVYVVGVDQKNISIGDPISHIFGHNYEAWANEFPEVVYVDHTSSEFGRTLIKPTAKNLVYYSDQADSDKLYDIIEQADYMINVANLKPHGRAGVSLTAKNHFGSHARTSAFHLHRSLISPVSLGNPTNNGYRKYRVMVDLMGSRYLGQNTLLFVVDGLYGGGSNETKVPVKYFMDPFNDDWCNSVFLSQDQVALESVCYDFLRTEWNGTYSHNTANNMYEAIPNVNGVDDYLHQAADAVNWPVGISYDPDHSGKPLASLGVHEHWNNAEKKQYSRNLGAADGIELIAIPETLVGGTANAVAETSGKKQAQQEVPGQQFNSSSPEKPKTKATTESKKITLTNRTLGENIQSRKFYAVTVDDENTKWFLTESGIVSFDGKTWVLHNKNGRILNQGLKSLNYDFSDFGSELWIATPQGATVASIPIDARSGATTYYLQNSPILSENVVSVAVGKGSLRWFGTDKGISAFFKDKWLGNAYQRKYPESLFREYPITAMATSPDGDSLYVATAGAGVTRVFRNNVDAISGASEYAQWGPIEIPSDKVYSICITSDGTQWFGTDKGIARHVGYKTLENWTVFDTKNGLTDNFVQSIAADKDGNIWFGTRNGVSVFNGSGWTSYTEKDGLTDNNVRCIKVDKEGVVWLGTDNGVTSYAHREFTCYK